MRAVTFDFKLALRGLARDGWFTLAAVVMLSLTLGLNVAVFAVMDAMLFRGFPHVAGNDRLLYLQERDAAGRCCISYADFEDWREQSRSFDGLAYVGTYSPITIRDNGRRALEVIAIRVSTNTFDLLGVSPLIGRGLVAADEAPGAPQVVLLNHRFWQTQFAGRRDIVGARVQVNDQPATIIGVMPDGFDFPTRESAWMPVEQAPQLRARGLTPGGFTVVARLRAGVTRQAATAELETINRQLAAAYPASNRDLLVSVASHSEMMSGPDATLIWSVLWVAAWFVLLVACATLAHLALMRSVGRWHEFATKLALGAGRARLVRQLLMEAGIVAAVSAPLAWGLAMWSVRQWAAITESRYQILNYAVDGRTLTYLSLVLLACVLLVSLAPVVRALHVGKGLALTPSARGTTADRGARRTASVLMAGQMALAIVLLSSAGLLVRSFRSIVGADTGVPHPERILVGSVRLPSATYSTPDARRRYLDRLDRLLVELPNVQSATLATTVPVRFAPPRAFEIEGRPGPDHEPPVTFVSAGPNYFHVLGVTVLDGRVFDPRDDGASAVVAVVNERFAAQYWPGQTALGKRVRVTEGGQEGPWLTIVGVVSNVLQADPLRQHFKPVVYVPLAQTSPPASAWFLASTTVTPVQLVEAVRASVRSLDPDVPLANLGSLEERFAFDRDLMDAEHSELGKHALVTPALAVFALLLSAGGLAVVMMHAVGQRTREIGVRMAIGAAVPDIRAMVVREGMRPVVAGVVIGLGVSLGVARILRSQLVGISPYDPATYAGAVTLVGAIALMACLPPARRAARVDPVVALRHE